MAQLVAQTICNRQVVGSIPTAGSWGHRKPYPGTSWTFRRAVSAVPKGPDDTSAGGGRDLDASGATSRAERRTTPVNLRHQPTRPSEDRTVGWSQRRACYLTTEVKGTTISIRQLNWHFAARSVDIR